MAIKMWKLMKTNQMRRSTGYLFFTHPSKGVNHLCCVLADTQRQAGDWGRFTGEKTRGLQVGSDWRLLLWGSWRWAN